MLYNTLLGNTDSLTESVLCQTWEDIVWAYLNGFLTEELELSRTSTSAYSYKEAFNRANFKDCILEKGDPRIFFHKVQSFIIQNDIGGLIEELYKAFVLKNAYSDLYTRPECFPGALRFAATLVLYGRQYCEWIEDDKSTAIVAQFTEFNSQADFFKPLTVIVYTSKLSQADQLSVYSKFLEDFVGDDEEIAILVHLSKQHNINIKETLEKTSNRLTQKAIVQMNNAQKEQATETFLRALQWLTVDKKLCLKALNTSNYIIRYLLKTRYHLEIANTISKAIPQELEIVASNIPDPEYNLKEHKSHKRFLNAFWLKKDWDSLLENKPIDDFYTNIFLSWLFSTINCYIYHQALFQSKQYILDQQAI
ncbi:nuclear pore protein 84/107 [Sporodiniella umbellata]|nr:nuclear pore protein 84/107 [Sporodiniella umbellata]